jgi:hypothetical protein
MQLTTNLCRYHDSSSRWLLKYMATLDSSREYYIKVSQIWENKTASLSLLRTRWLKFGREKNIQCQQISSNNFTQPNAIPYKIKR